jgi:hypothetical protein
LHVPQVEDHLVDGPFRGSRGPATPCPGGRPASRRMSPTSWVAPHHVETGYATFVRYASIFVLTHLAAACSWDYICAATLSPYVGQRT